MSPPCASARARKTRCCWPPDSIRIWRSARSDIPSSSSAPSTRSLVGPPHALEEPQRRVAALLDNAAHGDREIPVDRVALRHVGQARPGVLRVGVADPDLAGRQALPPEHGAKERALSRAVPSQDRCRAAARDVEGDVAKRDQPAVAHGRAPEKDDVLVHGIQAAEGGHGGQFARGAPGAARPGRRGRSLRRYPFRGCGDIRARVHPGPAGPRPLRGVGDHPAHVVIVVGRVGLVARPEIEDAPVSRAASSTRSGTPRRPRTTR